MEEFRGFLNLETPERKLITFVFLGLPDIEETLKLDEPLAQRVALKYRLEPFNEESTEAYINHRLRVSGAQRELFTKKAIHNIHLYSKGLPRTINTLCDNSIFEGFLLKANTIDENIVQNIAIDLGYVQRDKRKLETTDEKSEYGQRQQNILPSREGRPPEAKSALQTEQKREVKKIDDTGDEEIDLILGKINERK